MVLPVGAKFIMNTRHTIFIEDHKGRLSISKVQSLQYGQLHKQDHCEYNQWIFQVFLYDLYIQRQFPKVVRDDRCLVAVYKSRSINLNIGFFKWLVFLFSSIAILVVNSSVLPFKINFMFYIGLFWKSLFKCFQLSQKTWFYSFWMKTAHTMIAHYLFRVWSYSALKLNFFLLTFWNQC